MLEARRLCRLRIFPRALFRSLNRVLQPALQKLPSMAADMEDLEKQGTHFADFHEGSGNGNGSPLTRATTTLTLSNEQYERLFFQPSAPRRGDLAKRFGMARLTLCHYWPARD